MAFIVFASLLVIGVSFYKIQPLFFFIVEGIMVISVVLFIVLYRRLIKPYYVITSGMELMKEQDFSSRLGQLPDSEANKLIDMFNKMMEQLRNERIQVREKNHFLDLLIEASPQGVAILDFNGKIASLNPAAVKLLKISTAEDLIGKEFTDLSTEMGNRIAQLKPDEEVIVREANMTAYRCSRNSFFDKGFAHPFILIEELTSEIMEAEKKSYESLIRMMAHEVNNSVGAINATLSVIFDSISSAGNDDYNDVLPVVDASIERCYHLSHFINNLSNVVKIPKPMRSEVDVNQLVKKVKSLSQSECQARGIRFTLQLSPEANLAFIDEIQIEQVLLNILKNSYEAIGKEGEIKIITAANPTTIIVEDNGGGISDEVRRKIFTPFFTTKSNGQGIGLMFVREVLTNHKAHFDLRSEDGITRFEIKMSDTSVPLTYKAP
ncbi:ATP-binding protein [Bacteroidales bacterium OttesenSCG-928-B11]|nr:ATP-binding protein [Bacteroidales bacterium OttesenSCG-928-B11]MDL2325450.1 ATP-binding protein [Bacteroidales bacterium OttesenSCG-928-A14]